MVKKQSNQESTLQKKNQTLWLTDEKDSKKSPPISIDEIRKRLLAYRGLTTPKQIEEFLHPKNPILFTASDVGIDADTLQTALSRMIKAIKNKESIVVYADYDADGITAGTIMWETLHSLGASVMPYIPHRVEEGYGLSKKGIDTIVELYKPTLIVTVDHGITGAEKVAYAASLGIDVIVTDHHTKGPTEPNCTIVHTTQLCGAGVSWFVSKELRQRYVDTQGYSKDISNSQEAEHLALAAIGTVADLVSLIGPNRSIVKYGLTALNNTSRVGLLALIEEAGLTAGSLAVYNISHGLAPRLNAMGRLEHAMDALRLLCTKLPDKAMILARKIALTNKDRQQLTTDSAVHAKDNIHLQVEASGLKNLLFIADESYNQGIIGLIAGKLVEEFYRPSIVLAKGEVISKASARSIKGFNIVEAIRKQSDLLIDVGGHPMAAGFTVETKNLEALQKRLEALADAELTENMLVKSLHIDEYISLVSATESLWATILDFEPFGFGNFQPVFVSEGVIIESVRQIGKERKHLKLLVSDANLTGGSSIKIDAVAFNFGELFFSVKQGTSIDIAYTIDMNVWNGTSTLQIKIKDIHVHLID